MPRKRKKTNKIVKKINKIKRSKKFKKYKKFIYAGLIVLLIILVICGFIFFKNNNPKKEDKFVLKDNQLLYKGYIYNLPNGWTKDDNYTKALNIVFNSSHDDVISYNGGVINYNSISSTGFDADYLFKDISFFENSLKNGRNSYIVGEGKLINHGGKPVVIFPCGYVNSDTSKVLIVYMPADDKYYYDINFYSNRVIDNKDEMYFNYDDLYAFLDFLNSKEKLK